MTTVTTSNHKATLIHKEDQIYSYRDALFAKNKEATIPAEAWLVNVNGVVHKARTKKMAKEIIDYIVEANKEEEEFDLAPVVAAPAPKKRTKAEVKANILKDREAEAPAQEVEETYTMEQIAQAIKAVDSVVCWYDKPEYYKPLNYAVKLGYAYRNSTTQAGWTEAGIAAYHAEKAQEEQSQAEQPQAVVTEGLAPMLSTLKQGVVTKKADYEKSILELNMEELIPAVAMHESHLDKSEATGKVRIYMSKELFNNDANRKQIRLLKDWIKSSLGMEVVVGLYNVNKYMTIVDNCKAGHAFVLGFHYLNNWINKDATQVTATLLETL